VNLALKPAYIGQELSLAVSPSGVMPPWIIGGPYPGWVEVDPSSPLRWQLVIENKSDYPRKLIDIEAILSFPGRCNNVERQHHATIVAWVLWLVGTEGFNGSPWKASSMPGLFLCLRRAARWMIAEGFGRWDALGLDEILRLKEHMYRPDGGGAPTGPKGRENALLALRMLFSFYRLWGKMPDGFVLDPALDDQDVVRSLLRTYRKAKPDHVDDNVRGTRTIPWVIGQTLLAEAIEMVESQHVQTIIKMEAVARQLETQTRRHKTYHHVRRIATEELAKAASGSVNTRNFIAHFGIRGTSDIFNVHRDLVTACYIILATFGALRISEAAGLPRDGAIEMRSDGPWLNAIVLKTSPEQGGSVVPKVMPLIAVMAAQVAATATEATRDGKQELLVSHDHHRRRTVNFTKMVVGARLLQFAQRRAGVTPDQWKFASHQLRKLFVQLYVRRFEGSVEALQQHVGHISARMIEAYLHDPDILRMIKEEQKDLTSEIMAGVMAGTSVAAGRPAEAWRAQGAVYKARNMSLKEIASAVHRMLDADGIHLEPTSIGYCVSSVKSGAVGLCGRNVLGTPDHANRSDTMCLACPNGVATESSESRLKAEYVIHKQAAESLDSAPPMKEASRRRCLLIKQRLDELQAQNTLGGGKPQ
jgi:hypothetical protein